MQATRKQRSRQARKKAIEYMTFIKCCGIEKAGELLADLYMMDLEQVPLCAACESL